MKKNYAYLLALMLLVFGTKQLDAQCIPTSVRPVFGTVTGSTGTQTFTNMPNGNVVQITAPSAGVFYTFSMCQTNGGVAQADGVDDSHLTVITANSTAATSLGFNDDFCPTSGPNGWGPSEVTYTSTAAGTFFIYLTEWGAVDECNDDGLNTNYVLTVTKTSTPPPCTAGGLTTAGFPLSICPGDTFVAASDGTESTAGGFGVYFSPQATGGGGLNGAFTLSNTTYPYVGDNDLNGVLSANSFPVLTGEYAIYLVSYSDVNDASNTICSTSTDSIMVTFLSAGDAGCAPPAPCDAGVISTVGFPLNFCPGDSFTISTDGSEVTPTDYALFFSPQAGATGANGVAFNLTGVTFPYTSDEDLGGVLSGQATPLPPLSGTWAVYTRARDGVTICSTSTDSVLINFLDATDPLCAGTPGTPCVTAANTYNDLNTVGGGAPCNDGAGCVITDPGFTTLGVYGSEAYQLSNVQAGYDYVFDMCTGFGAGAWIPAITIVAPSGAVDAFNLGTTGTFLNNCSLAWTASESGMYTIVIHETGVACGTETLTDNGNPTVTCGTNPAPCITCDAGTLVSAATMTICSNDFDSIVLSGNSTPGTYELFFDNTAGGTGADGTPFTLTGFNDAPFYIDNDLGGVLSGQATPLPPLVGLWDVTVYTADLTGAYCDSLTTIININFLDSSDVACTNTPPCSISDITAGTQSACDPATNTYTQDIIVTFSNAPSTGVLDVNGQSFPIGTSPQTVTLTGLNAGVIGANDVSASFSADMSCVLAVNNLFTAPASCSCLISDLAAGAQTPCVNTTNEYTQEVIVTYANAPASGSLTVNGQNFPITGSPQTVVLTGLNSNGAGVNVSAIFTADPSCDYSETNLFLAPAGCLCPTINVNVATTNVTNCASPNGTATATASGGTGTYTYAWTPSSFGSGATISNIPSGTYTVVATDVNGCTGSGTGNVNNTSGVNALVGNVNNVSCFGGNDGAISVTASGGTAPISYTWSDQGFPSTVSSRTNLTAGNYTIVVSDNGGCSVVLGPISISEPDQLVVVVDNSSNITCAGASNGAINVSVNGGNGGNNYSWTNGGGNNEDPSGLGAGNYQLTVTDNLNCTASSNMVMITEPDVISISLDSENDVTCFGANDGNILVTVSGGTGNLSYNWDNAPNIEDVLGAGPGSYQLTVTDINNCSAMSSVYTITEPDELVITITDQTDVTCYQANNGTITANVTGGTGIYTSVWTNGAGTSLSPSNLGPNSYQLSVTDANNCSATSSVVTISEPSFVTATISSTNSSSSASTGTATVVASGGTAPYTYKWNDAANQTNSAATGLAPGNYTCTITDANGCTHTISTDVGVTDAIGELALNGLSIYPNPSNGLFTIEFESFEKLDFDIKLMNTIGKVVYSNTYSNVSGVFNEQFDFAKFTNGIYFIELSNKDAKSVERITISK